MPEGFFVKLWPRKLLSGTFFSVKSINIFEALIVNPFLIESQNMEVCLKSDDFSEETLNLFEKLMNTNCNIHDEMNVGIEEIFDLMIFADRFLMQHLVEICINHLTNLLSQDNVIDVIQLACRLSNTKLMKIASAYSITNQRKLTENHRKEWKEFCSKNPECLAKMMESLILN